MTPEDIRLVQTSYEKIRPDAGKLGELFYHQLFTTQPDLQKLFRGNMEAQRHMFVTALGLVVSGLDRPETIRASVDALSLRHTSYGVSQSYYAVFGAALIWTLEQMLGDEFTPAVRHAWGEAFTTLAQWMKNTPQPTA